MALPPDILDRLRLTKTKPLSKPKALPKPKKVGAFDPYNATTDDLAKFILSQQLQGADYSQIPAPRSPDLLSGLAGSQASAMYSPVRAEYQDLSGTLDRKRKISTDAATAFAQAMAEILQGGKTGAEGMQFAKENYGGSYLGALAGEMGKDLLRQITADFDEQDFKLADRLATLASDQQETYVKLLNDLQQAEAEDYQAGVKFVDSKFETRIKALSGYLATRMKQEKETASEAGGKKSGPGGTERQVVYVNGVPYLVDPVTGKSEPAVPGTGNAQGAKTATKKAASEGTPGKVYGNSETGYFTIKNGRMVPIPGYTGGSSGKGSTKAGSTGSGGDAAQPSTTPYEVRKIGERAVENVTDAIWAKMPGSNAEEGTPEYAKADAAYQDWLGSGKSFKTAMTRVIQAIGPSLRKTGFNSSQVREAAYRIVAAEMDPPKGYKPPKASAARVAANKLPKQVGNGIPVVNTTGSKSVPKAVQTILRLANEYLGVPYVWGGKTPKGFDCSGLVQYLYKKVGVNLPGYTIPLFATGGRVQNQADLQPGDAVFFNWGTHPETGEQGPLHMGLYLGDGLFLQAPRTGDVVKISRMSERNDFLGGRRYVQAGTV